jgi:hypothetical protein
MHDDQKEKEDMSKKNSCVSLDCIDKNGQNWTRSIDARGYVGAHDTTRTSVRAMPPHGHIPHTRPTQAAGWGVAVLTAEG